MCMMCATAGHVPNADQNACEPCPKNQIAKDGKCQACPNPLSEIPNSDQSDCVMYGNPMDPEVSMSGAPPGKIAIQPEKKRVRKRPETNREPMKKGPKDSKYMHIAPDPNSCVCPECDKVFAHRKNMIAHYKSQHEGTRVTCQYCSKEIDVSNFKK